MKKLLHHLFVPHHHNNHRSKLLHHSSLIIIILAISILTLLGVTLKNQSPSILGISYSIAESDLLNKTNQARAENGLPPLDSNAELSRAAQGKAQHMLIHNYWSHFAPDGTSPWVFINDAGYNYVYAGENLAKGFTKSDEIVNAWMNSPTHRENILSEKYSEIGFAVVEGDLLGEETVLVVQMFGASQNTLAHAENNTQETTPQSQQAQQTPQTQAETATEESMESEERVGIEEEQAITEFETTQETIERADTKIENSPTVNADIFSQSITLVVFSTILFTLLVDIAVASKKKIPRMVGNNIDHILLISIFVLLILVQSRGGII